MNTAILNNVRFNTSLLHTVIAVMAGRSSPAITAMPVCERGMHVPLQDERLDKGANDRVDEEDPTTSAMRDVLDARYISASSYEM